MIKEIEMRRSIRKYIDKPVENEKITEILESESIYSLINIDNM